MAAVSPDLTEPSIVAGSPVFVQSPAKITFFQGVFAFGLDFVDPAVCANVALFSFTILNGGSGLFCILNAVHRSFQRDFASNSFFSSINSSAALTVTDKTLSRKKTQSAVPPTIPRNFDLPGILIGC